MKLKIPKFDGSKSRRFQIEGVDDMLEDEEKRNEGRLTGYLPAK